MGHLQFNNNTDGVLYNVYISGSTWTLATV